MSISFSEQILTPGSTALTTKGDILVHNGTSATRRSVGSNGQAIYANTSSVNGVYWSTAPSAPAFGLVAISTASVTADAQSVTFSGIPSTYKDLVFIGISSNTSTARTINECRVRANDVSSASSYDYTSSVHNSNNTAGYDATYLTNTGQTDTSIRIGAAIGNQTESEYPGFIRGSIHQYADTQKHKTGFFESMCVYNDVRDLANSPYGFGIAQGFGAFTIRSNSAITSLTFYSGSGLTDGFKSGSYFVLYGRK
jgi:hypothetical protein